MPFSTTRPASTSACGGPTRRPASTRPPTSSTSAEPHCPRRGSHPGRPFDVRGTSVEIDGVDLGTTRNPATVARRFCPACGWSERVGPDVTATARPRCHTPAAAATGQLLTTLPFRRARPTPPASSRCATTTLTSAAAPAPPCSPRSRRRRYDIMGTVWWLHGDPFGAEAPAVADIRRLRPWPQRAGRRHPHDRGQEVTTPSFDAGRHCGVVVLAERGVRERAEARHRGWRRQRKEPDPDGRTSLALTHELRTQAVRLLVRDRAGRPDGPGVVPRRRCCSGCARRSAAIRTTSTSSRPPSAGSSERRAMSWTTSFPVDRLPLPVPST